MKKVIDVIADLSRRKRSVACSGKTGLRAILLDLGFYDTEGDTPGHRVFTHDSLNSVSDFYSFSIDCGHHPKREMKLPYVVKTISVLRKYQEQLDNYLEVLEENGHA